MPVPAAPRRFAPRALALAASTAAAATCSLALWLPEASNAQGTAALSVSVDRIEDEAAAVVRAAEVGGPAGLRKTLEDCWFSSAGYGIEALAPCVTRESAALSLTAALEARIGPLGDPALTATAARDRIETAYEARGGAPMASSAAARTLIDYAVARRVRPGWRGAPSLDDVADWAAEARRVQSRDGASAYRDAGSGCWIRLALATPDDPEKAAASAWRCQVSDMAAGALETRDPARAAFFAELAGPSAAASPAVAAATEALAAIR